MKTIAAALATALLISNAAGATGFAWRGEGWYVLDAALSDPVISGPFGSKGRCLDLIARFTVRRSNANPTCSYHSR